MVLRNKPTERWAQVIKQKRPIWKPEETCIMSEITITLCYSASGASESMPVLPSMSIADCLEFARALLGIEGDLVIAKDGKRLVGATLRDAGVQHGDILVVVKNNPQIVRPPPPAAAGGLDFSNLLGSTAASCPAPTSVSHGGGGGGGGGLDFSNLLSSSSSRNTSPTPPVYYPGMNLDNAMQHNPHPEAIVKLLQTHSHLTKELNYHNPVLANKLQNQPYEKAVEIWRSHVVKGSIQNANAITQSFHQEQQFQSRLQQNPDDEEAKSFFDSKRKRPLVQQHYHQAMEEYPESMGNVLMLYIEAKINGHTLQAFVDSGAQMTIMSKQCAEKCGMLDYVDTRFAGVAVGVGTGKILGRIHIAQLQIGESTFLPCSVTVLMDDAALPTSDKDPKPKEMEFLLGLDMLKRHLCSMDLEKGCLKFRLQPGKYYLETPFLFEKDLDASRGGTKGFDAERANRELEEARRRYEEEKESKKKSGDGDDTMEE